MGATTASQNNQALAQDELILASTRPDMACDVERVSSSTTSGPSVNLSRSTAPATNMPGTPIVVRPDPCPPGLWGRLQTWGAVLFLALMASSLYLVVASALYIVIGLGVLGHRVLPSILLGVWVGQALIPVKKLHQNPAAIKRSWLFREMTNYFEMTLVMEEKLDTRKLYMFAQHPHGILPLCPVLSAYFVSDVVPGGKIFCLIHSGIFHLPIVRFFMGEWGALTADKESVAKARQEGEHCSIVVGGVAEMFLQSKCKEQVQLRKGFIREALRNGYDIVPMFHYGATRMYRFIGSASFWRSLSSCLPFPFFLVGGRGSGLTLVPKRVHLVTVVGSPMNIAALYGAPAGQPVPEPDPAKVDEIYDKWKKKVACMYYRHRPKWETRDIDFIESFRA